jgi:hypothetical protein
MDTIIQIADFKVNVDTADHDVASSNLYLSSSNTRSKVFPPDPASEIAPLTPTLPRTYQRLPNVQREEYRTMTHNETAP